MTSSPVDPVSPVPDPPAENAPPADGAPAAGISSAAAWQARANEWIEKGSQAAGLDPATFLPLFLGTASLLLVVLSSLTGWYSYRMNMVLMGANVNESEFWRGISYLEGKTAFVVALAGAVAVFVGIAKRSWLPAAIAGAGAAATLCACVTFSLRWKLATMIANARAELAQTKGLYTQFNLDSVIRETGSQMPTIGGGPSWTLALALLLAAGAAAAFFLASMRQPLKLAFFEKPGLPPLVQKYGAVGACYAAAIILGLMLAVVSY